MFILNDRRCFRVRDTRLSLFPLLLLACVACVLPSASNALADEAIELAVARGRETGSVGERGQLDTLPEETR